MVTRSFLFLRPRCSLCGLIQEPKPDWSISAFSSFEKMEDEVYTLQLVVVAVAYDTIQIQKNFIVHIVGRKEKEIHLLVHPVQITHTVSQISGVRSFKHVNHQ